MSLLGLPPELAAAIERNAVAWQLGRVPADDLASLQRLVRSVMSFAGPEPPTLEWDRWSDTPCLILVHGFRIAPKPERHEVPLHRRPELERLREPLSDLPRGYAWKSPSTLAKLCHDIHVLVKDHGRLEAEVAEYNKAVRSLVAPVSRQDVEGYGRAPTKDAALRLVEGPAGVHDILVALHEEFAHGEPDFEIRGGALRKVFPGEAAGVPDDAVDCVWPEVEEHVGRPFAVTPVEVTLAYEDDGGIILTARLRPMVPGAGGRA